MSIALYLFCLTVLVTMTSAADLCVFIGVGGWVKPNHQPQSKQTTPQPKSLSPLQLEGKGSKALDMRFY